MFRTSYLFAVALLAANVALAGTTTIGFGAGLGPLDNNLSGPGNFSANGNTACFSGANTTLLGESGPLTASGTVTMEMTLQPSSANPTFGFTLIGNAGVTLTALTDAAGNVEIRNSLGDSDTTFFSFPNASNNYMRLEYSTLTDTATVFVPGGSGGERSASIQAIALDGATGFQLGVVSTGTGCFDDFIASGSSIPNYVDPQPTVIDFPLNEGQQVPVTGSIATGCGTATLSADQTTLRVEVEHGVYLPEDAHIHIGAAGVNGAVVFPFTSAASPMDQTFNVNAQNVTDLLAGDFYVNIHTDAFPSGEIRGQIVDSNDPCTVTVDPGPIDTDGDGVEDDDDAFPVNPYGTTDTDGDGIGDEWEDFWFGDLVTATAGGDFDNDGVLDIVEFQNAIIGFDPTDGISELPLAGAGALAALAGALVLTARRKR